MFSSSLHPYCYWDAVNFGNVEIESSIQKQLIIYNSNPFSIQIDSINSSIESVYIDEYNKITIGDLDTIYIPISFQPHIEGPYDGYCYIYEENGIAHQIELIGWTSIVIENELTSLNEYSICRIWARLRENFGAWDPLCNLSEGWIDCRRQGTLSPTEVVRRLRRYAIFQAWRGWGG